MTEHLIVSDANTNMAYQIDWPTGNIDFAELGIGTEIISARPIQRD